MSLSEAPIFFFSCLCRWQKRLFSPFCAYVVVRSDYFLFFMLMSLTKAIIFFFSCLCRWQKRFFSSFRIYVVDRSDYFLHFAFMSLTEAIIFSIPCLCRWQKHQFSFFRAYVVVRSVGKTLFSLTEWCCSLKFLVLSPSNREYCFQTRFWSLRIG